MSYKGQVSHINNECVVNPSEATPRRGFILGVFWAYAANLQGRGHQRRSMISMKIHSNSFVGMTLMCVLFHCHFAASFLDTISWDGL